MYIGRTPVLGNFVKLDAITTSATATYNLLNGGVAYFPQTANNCIVSLNGVIQSPTSAYTISGSTIVFSDALTSSDTIDFILVLGDVLSIGTPSDGTITSAKLASGTDGLFAWQSVQTTGFTAVAARAYPCNTTSSAFTVTLPASPSVGDQVLLLDYAGTFDTNAITLAPNGNKINGSTSNRVLNTEREAVTITYVDSTQGWLASSGVNEGTFSLAPAPYSIDFLVVAGGGGAGATNPGNAYAPGGGGAGGFRTSTQSVAISTAITVTVGDGGAVTTAGSNSSISGSGLTTITSAGGGDGAESNSINGGSGGSGGGGSSSPGDGIGGSGNTPSTSPSQGNNGGTGTGAGNTGGGGGGGASAVGSNGSGGVGGNGGNGTASSITGSSVTYAGGGGGGAGYNNINGTTGGTGGTGGGGNGSASGNGTNGTANTGGGGGAGAGGSSRTSGSGGKGIVILSMPTSNYTGTTTGSPTVTTSGSNTVLTFNGSGSYTA